MSDEIVTINNGRNVGNYLIVESGTNDSQVVQMWCMKSRSSETRYKYERAANELLTYTQKPIQAISLNDLRRWQDSLTGKINTKKLKVSIIKSMFAFMQKIGYIQVNPAIMISAEKAEETAHARMMTEEEVIRIMTHESLSARDGAIVRTLYSSGMRVGELCGLRWRDVIATDGGKAIFVIRGKGSKTRKSGISATTYSKILEIRDGATLDDYVFRSNRKSGLPMDKTTVNYLFEKLSKIVGRKISPHFMRHCNASHSLKRGASAVDVMNQLGHSSLSVTSKYVHSDRSASDYLIV